MSRIKCRYNKIYCGNVLYRMNRARCCDPDKCEDMGICPELDYQWVAGENVGLCKAAHPAIVEFEKTVKEYEYNEAENTLSIGRQDYPFLEYLEIDGRVLVKLNDAP